LPFYPETGPRRRVDVGGYDAAMKIVKGRRITEVDVG
jgi:hypothetical protein